MAFKFETANERWRQFTAETDPFLDPSELTNPDVVAQHEQNFAEIKNKISELYEAFVAGRIGASQFATGVNDAVKDYENKTVRY